MYKVLAVAFALMLLQIEAKDVFDHWVIICTEEVGVVRLSWNCKQSEERGNHDCANEKRVNFAKDSFGKENGIRSKLVNINKAAEGELLTKHVNLGIDNMDVDAEMNNDIPVKFVDDKCYFVMVSNKLLQTNCPTTHKPATNGTRWLNQFTVNSYYYTINGLVN
ncbi:hypothetical protein WR25_25011 [Diploscapter pachys]|uniref:Uncharacterized protein n=1 Tax=Diploscapter pachys TaxID=2018661 RepID=A0A2A2JZW7_9BILA|nr:hypothetical protein WR25_25011 [Diploscapter pachys]